MKKCFGIVSWFPDIEPDRSQRQERLNRLFKQLNELWPDIDILIITQNWKTFKSIDISNKIVRKDFIDGLGILKARQTLREEFLKSKYEYLIMLDDDCIIELKDNSLASKYMSEIDKHPNGFCFIHSNNPKTKFHPYIGAQLNLCAISRFIYTSEPMVPIDPQKNEGYEDSIFATLLHHKYSKYEFIPPKGIMPIQFNNPKERVPSTWCDREKKNIGLIHANSNRIKEYILIHKDLPRNLDEYIEKEIKEPSYKADGRKDCYLYF